MRDPIYSIVEKLAILEGRIAPTDRIIAETTTKQKKPALFNNLKKDESAIPMVGGVEFAEDTMEEDVLDKVKSSFVDYLKSIEDRYKDSNLKDKKKEDSDLKKKDPRDRDLIAKVAKELEEDHQKLEIGDRICVIGHNDHQGEFGNITEFSPSGKFVVVDLGYGKEISMHLSDVEYHDDQEDWEDGEHDAVWDLQHGKELDEDPNQTPAGGEAPAGLTDPTYAESAPVKSMNFPLEEMGGSVLVEIHGDERDGFRIRRAGKELSTRFKSLEECEIALEMFAARRKEKAKAAGTAD
jgi:hypothetical protein